MNNIFIVFIECSKLNDNFECIFIFNFKTIKFGQCVVFFFFCYFTTFDIFLFGGAAEKKNNKRFSPIVSFFLYLYYTYTLWLVLTTTSNKNRKKGFKQDILALKLNKMHS